MTKQLNETHYNELSTTIIFLFSLSSFFEIEHSYISVCIFPKLKLDPEDHIQYHGYYHTMNEPQWWREILAARNCVLKILIQLFIHFKS